MNHEAIRCIHKPEINYLIQKMKKVSKKDYFNLIDKREIISWIKASRLFWQARFAK